MLRKINTAYGKSRAIRGNIMDSQKDSDREESLPIISGTVAYRGQQLNNWLRSRRNRSTSRALARTNDHNRAVAIRSKAEKRNKLGFLGKAGLTAIGLSALAGNKVKQGYHDRMEQYGLESAAPLSKPNLKTGVDAIAPSTSTAISKTVKTTAGKLKPGGKGVYKGKKPLTSVGPKKGANTPVKPVTPTGASASITPAPSKEDIINARAIEYRQGMAGISMVKPAVGVTKPIAVKKSPQKAQESKEALIGNLLEKKFRYESEARAKARLGSKADITLRKGTGVRHTFRTNDKKHQFYGRPLSMRQKLLAEHKRKGFALPEDFANLDPVSIGKHFDYLSDRGMLEKRKNLDPSNWNYVKRKIKRHYKRGKKKIADFYKGIVRKFHESGNIFESNAFEPEAKVAENEKDFCDFEVGNVKYPEDCNCKACSSLLETAGSSFGANMRDGTQPTSIKEKTPQISANLLRRIFMIRRQKGRKKFRKQLVRESLEDLRREQFINDELAVHQRNPEPIGLLKRRKSYFNIGGTLAKLDRLGQNIALTAVALNGLAPMARNIITKNGPGFVKAAKRAAQSVRSKMWQK